jgi:hypothetical protein
LIQYTYENLHSRLRYSIKTLPTNALLQPNMSNVHHHHHHHDFASANQAFFDKHAHEADHRPKASELAER